eukprot:TRINITY_DN37862_c0_g1_i1.p1 TRINITY_DN37862_c0_g1~~TRINITY_DN37862_c0_g1_i1.p1  ORF type:complete len:487 (+),score=123.08 TRINITY_DN37862_c0_g1_i1:56-1462(+)
MSATGESRKPADTPFKQQRLWAWQPILAPRWVISCFFFIAAAFIPIGALVIVASNDVQEVEVKYGNLFSDCPWMKGPDACFEECTSQPCMGADSTDCGMIGSLGVGCPRVFNKNTVMTVDKLKNMSGCDPKCTKTVKLEIKETMDPPIYLYYKLTDFYQNHRRYAKSRSDVQLAGDEPASADIADCDPLKNPSLAPDAWCKANFQDTSCGRLEIIKCPAQAGGPAVNSTTATCVDEGDKRTTVGDLLYSPCGLVAWSAFNDTFKLTTETGDMLCDGSLESGGPSCTKEGIAWDADRNEKFKEPALKDGYFTYKGFKADMDTCMDTTNTECNTWARGNVTALLPFLYYGWYNWEPYHKMPRPTDEDFMVWMRTASLSTFRKLYRKIDKQLQPGTYLMVIDHRFDISGFSGEKYFILSTLTWIGGKNYFLGATYIAIGCLCVILAITFTIKHMFFRTNRQEAMASYQNPR